MVFSSWPRSLAHHDWEEARVALREFARDHYDLVWFSHAEPWVALHDLVNARSVIDLDNLYDQLLRSRRGLSVRSSGPVGVPWSHRPRRAAAWTMDRLDEWRWGRLQRRAADYTHAVVVCSQLDRDRFGHRRTFVLANCYEPGDLLSASGAGSAAPSAPSGAGDPVFTMVGTLVYPPNLDAALVAAHEIMPRVRVQRRARLRLIGRCDDRALALSSLSYVELLGEVSDLPTALSGTDVVIVPIRSGSGTRIKVLEAFARRLPVVSTSIGCEGLGAKDGEHLLVADVPDGFAAACIRLLDDPELRDRITDAAHSLWSQHFRCSSFKEQVVRIALEATGPSLTQTR
jgi:glycosyltransferase involved in cell wall biosynthesis